MKSVLGILKGWLGLVTIHNKRVLCFLIVCRGMKESMKKNLAISRVYRVIGVVIGIIAFLWFLLPFVVAGIMNIGNATGIVVSGLFVIYMMFLSVIHKWIARMWSKIPEKYILIAGGLVLGMIAFLVVEQQLLLATNYT